MRKLLLVICLVAFSVTSGSAQERAIRKTVENAIAYQNMRIGYRSGTKVIDRLYYDVKNCRFKEDALRSFMRKHPEYKITFGDVEREYQWGYYEETIVSFTVSLNDFASNSLIFAIRLANNNKSLQMPSYHNLQESSVFYQNYVKRFSELSEIFKSAFFPEFTNYVKNNPDGMKRFCDGSPYSNKELLKDIDVWKLLAESKKAQYAYVYLQDAGKGYIFDSRGRYEGPIKNGLAEGEGTFYDNEGQWVGTFKNGKRNGSFTNTQSLGGYGVYKASWYGVFIIQQKGTCVNDKWDGEVVKTVTTTGVDSPYRNIYTRNSDVEKLYYSQGTLLRSSTVSSSLSNYLTKEMEVRKELAIQAKRESQRRWEEEQAAKQAAQAADEAARVAAANRKGKVEFSKSYTVMFPNDGQAVEYHVTFGDGTRGCIGKVDWQSYWCIHTRWNPDLAVSSPLGAWRYGGKTQEEAVDALYEALH